MRPGDLLQMLRRRPFPHLRLHLTGGIVHEVRHPEMAMVGQSLVWIEFPGSDGPLPVAKREFAVALLHIVQVEVLPLFAPPSAN